MYHVPFALQLVYGCIDERSESGDGEDGDERFMEEGREWRLPGLLYADNLVMYGDWKEDLKVMVDHFVEVCRRRGVKVNGDKSKVMLLGGEEELKYKIHVDGVRLEQV